MRPLDIGAMARRYPRRTTVLDLARRLRCIACGKPPDEVLMLLVEAAMAELDGDHDAESDEDGCEVEDATHSRWIGVRQETGAGDHDGIGEDGATHSAREVCCPLVLTQP